jgi:hypothetical protein
MKYREYWAKVWTLHDNGETGGDVVPPGSKFWLQPVSVDREIVCYSLCFEQGLNKCLQGTKLYPVGVTHMKCDTLPAWKDGDPILKAKYLNRAFQVQSNGRTNSYFKRLEGTFERDTEGGPEQQIVRMYCLAQGEDNGRDWFVLDIIRCAYEAPLVEMEHLFQDGVAHGDDN